MSILSFTLSASRTSRAGLCLAVMLVLGLSAGRVVAETSSIEGSRPGTGPGLARATIGAPAPPLAWSLTGLFKSNLTRTRAIQGAAVCMALGLFILMKKFADVGDGVGRRAGDRVGRSGGDRTG